MRKERVSLKRNICLVYLVIGFVYGIILPLMWHNNPFDPLGTLSVLCENRKPFFWFWVLLDTGSLCCNFYYLYYKYEGKTKFSKIFPVLAFVSASVIALTLGHDITTWNPKRIAHWISTGAYIVMLFACVAVYSLENFKSGAKSKELLIAVFLILMVFLVGFIVFGKSGVLEAIPNLMLQIFLFLENFVFRKQPS